MAAHGQQQIPTALSKNMLRKLRKQIAFYFSDSNLQKDQYLRHLVESSVDGFVALEEFLKFNRVSEITQDIEGLKMALEFESEKARGESSVVLELNALRTAVRRTNTIHFEPVDDVDERTLYVECLPPDYDDRLLRSAFAQFGVVAYVNLPKFSTSGDPCGFALVEFRTRQSAQAAITALANEDGYHQFIANLSKSSRRLQMVVSLAKELEKLDIRSFRPDDTANNSRSLFSQKLDVTSSEVSSEADCGEPTSKRRRLKKRDSSRSSDVSNPVPLSDTIRYFVVYNKKDWLKMKDSEAFRSDHRERARVFKQALKQVSEADHKHKPSVHPASATRDELAAAPEQTPIEATCSNNKDSTSERENRTRNKHKRAEKPDDSKIQNSVNSNSKNGPLEGHGTVVRFHCQAGTSKKSLKSALLSYANDIAYIDVLDGATFGYFRVKSAACALLNALGLYAAEPDSSSSAPRVETDKGHSGDSSTCNSDVRLHLDGYRFELLRGEDEAAYWSKIAIMRDAKTQNAKFKQKSKLEVTQKSSKNDMQPAEPTTTTTTLMIHPVQHCSERKHIIFDD